MSREAYNQWVQNYLVQCSGVAQRYTRRCGSCAGGMEQSNRRSQIYLAAKAIVDLKRRWTAATTVRHRTQHITTTNWSIRRTGRPNYLHQMTPEQAQNYLKRCQNCTAAAKHHLRHGVCCRVNYGSLPTCPKTYGHLSQLQAELQADWWRHIPDRQTGRYTRPVI